jgi:type IV pilus assembly protein PilQ
VNRLLTLNSLLLGGALVALAAEPGAASITTITGIRLNQSDAGLEVVLDTQGSDASNVFTVSQGNSLRADITRAQLSLPDGNSFSQSNPAPGISEITVVPLDANSVRVTVNGNGQAPTGAISSTGNRMVMAVRSDGQATQQPTPVPAEIETIPAPTEPTTTAQAPPPAQPAPANGATPTAPTQADPNILVPNPEVVIDGQPVPRPQVQQAPPFLPRAVAPPVGDIAVAESIPAFGAIDLGSNERIPKLLLRDAPSREVLSLLARAAGLNLVFTPAAAGQAGAAATGDGPAISLDIENESVQDVFNHVLRVSGLQANRVGRSIYVGPSLPVSAQTLNTRTLRLNQVDATVAANFLVALGAESAVSRERLVTNVNAVEVGEGVPPITETQTTTVDQIETQRVDYTDSQAILRGLQVIADERTNSVTLVGRGELIAIATEQLTRIDIRRRQVAINVRVIDIDLNALDAFGTSFSFQTGNFGAVSSGGLGILNLGIPGVPSAIQGGVPGSTPIGPRALGGPGTNATASNFLFQLLATVQNGNGKIITDPTLIVQEGQTATVQLTQDVVTEVTTTVTIPDTGPPVTTSEIQTELAGLILQINVNRIDDNGFVSLSVAPSISAPTEIFDSGQGNIVLLSRRQLSSGQVRVRDSQTLLLSGIIQESERSTVTKIPILGDIPILGALFRSTITDNQRRELIVLLTPQIIDDSDQNVFGYSYTPSEQVQELLENQQR